MGKLKVYGWTGIRNTSQRIHNQSREIVAASSIAEVLRITGMARSEWAWSGSQTWNETEEAVALARPGVVFWAPLNDKPELADWTAVEPD